MKYWFISDWASVQQFVAGQSFMQYKQGDVVNDAVRMQAPFTGKVYFMLSNDNSMEPIDITVKENAVVVKRTVETRAVKEPKVTQRKEAYSMNP